MVASSLNFWQMLELTGNSGAGMQLQTSLVILWSTYMMIIQKVFWQWMTVQLCLKKVTVMEQLLDLQAVMSHDGLLCESLSLVRHCFCFATAFSIVRWLFLLHYIIYIVPLSFPCCFKTNLFSHSFYLWFILCY